VVKHIQMRRNCKFLIWIVLEAYRHGRDSAYWLRASSSHIRDELAKKRKNLSKLESNNSVFYLASYHIFYFLPLASKKKTTPTSYHVFYLEELLDFIIFSNYFILHIS
jgi:hypothetical protein